MKQFFLTGVACLLVLSAIAQSSVIINQSGGSGNRAVVSQQGTGNSVSINQSNTHTSNSRQKPGNRVSLRVDSTTQTTINQQSDGPNSVEFTQNGQATTMTLNQSSATHENTLTRHPYPPQSAPTVRTPKRRNRR